MSGDFLKNRIRVIYEGAPANAFVDPEQMKQAFLNIIMNAIDAMPEGGVMTVSSCPRPADAGLFISISDTGCGISEDKLNHIFDPFYTSKEQGTGLGLAVTHSIIQKNGGKIEVQSKVDAGTTFKICLLSGNIRCPTQLDSLNQIIYISNLT